MTVIPRAVAMPSGRSERSASMVSYSDQSYRAALINIVGVIDQTILASFINTEYARTLERWASLLHWNTALQRFEILV